VPRSLGCSVLAPTGMPYSANTEWLCPEAPRLATLAVLSTMRGNVVRSV
jgi:hypothetical protein